MNGFPVLDVAERAAISRGASAEPIHRMVRAALARRGLLAPRGGPERTLVDVGAGGGRLWSHLRDGFTRYIGVDAVRYPEWPVDGELYLHDLDAGPVPLPNGTADVVASVETIEHLENPWAFVRDLSRLARPGGWVAVTTPNQLSLLSKGTLVVHHQFNAFRDSSYPAHRTALLECDLRRIAEAAGLEEVDIAYTRQGRLPLTGRHVPQPLSRVFPRAFSDNVLVIGRRPRIGS